MVFFWKAGTSYTEGSGLRIEFYTDCMITSQAHLMTVLKQLLKEFWLPLLAAIVWTSYNIWEVPQWSIRTVLNVWVPTFFFVSWLASQWYRVRKQQKVETGLSNIEERIKQTLAELDAKTADLAAYITGGESVCWLIGIPVVSDIITEIAVQHVGKHPLYEVNARIVDLEVFEEIRRNLPHDHFGRSETYHQFGNLIPGHTLVVPANISMGNASSRNFNIFYTARNGSFTQELRYRRVNGGWLYATKVSRGNITLHEQVQEGFPLNANGGIDW